MPNGVSPKVNLALRTWRHDNGWKQKEVAVMLGVSAPYICALEQGRTPVTMTVVRKLPAEARRVVIEALILEHYARITELRAMLAGEEA